MMKILNTCISRTKAIVIAIIVLMSTILIASVISSNDEEGPSLKEQPPQCDIDSSEVHWTPTMEDMAYQDSMFCIIEQTSMDVDTIKEAIDHILYKLERIEHADGTIDSIRYIEGGAIDQSRNQ